MLPGTKKASTQVFANSHVKCSNLFYNTFDKLCFELLSGKLEDSSVHLLRKLQLQLAENKEHNPMSTLTYFLVTSEGQAQTSSVMPRVAPNYGEADFA